MRRTALQRKTPLARGKYTLRRSKRVRAVNRERKSKRYARDFGDEAARVREMPCLITGTTPSEPAHVTSRGAGGGRFDLVPLSPAMHLQQHAVGIESFQACHGLDLRAEADCIALEHPEPLGIRGLARRWAGHVHWRQEVACASCDGRGYAVGEYGDGSSCSDCDGTGSAAKTLDNYEREALLGWVRRRMERERERRYDAAFDDVDAAMSMEECERFAADRESLAHDVMTALGWETLGSDPAGEHGIGWTLCEAAGWPS